jgi:hypothetical protein
LVRDFAEHFDVAVCSKKLIYMYKYESGTFSEGEYLEDVLIYYSWETFLHVSQPAT